MFADLPPQIIECAAQAEHAQPSDVILEEANAARLAGDYAGAQRAIDGVLATEPMNADAWVQLGFLRSATGEAAQARAAFRRALDIAPDYDDAKLGLAQLAYRAGDIEGAREWLRSMSPARLQDPEVRAFERSLMASAGNHVAWRWDAFAAYNELSNDLAPWREASLAVSRRDGDISFGAGVEHVERFGLSDVYGEVRVGGAAGQGTWGVALGGASHPSFRPEAAIRLELATAEDRDWALDGSLTIARYGVGEIDRFGLRVARRLGARARVNAQAIVVRDETGELRTGYSVGAAQRVGDKAELSLVWADAPESSEGATIDVRSLGLGIAVDVTPRLRLRVGALREERDAFDRAEVSFAVTRTF